MRRRKRQPAETVRLDLYDLGKLQKAVGALNNLAKADVYVSGGELSLYNYETAMATPVGPVFYNAALESYVIEWNR